jgi:6-phosphogluconate dehydrogenase
MIGLGRMGTNITERLARGGQQVIAYNRSPEAMQRKDFVEDSGEGRWTVQEAIERNVPAPVLMLLLFARFASRQDSSCSAKVIAALRNEFGGHAVKKE